MSQKFPLLPLRGHTLSTQAGLGGGGYQNACRLVHGTAGWIFKKRGYEGDNFLFRTVIKISKIQFTQFLQTSAIKFSHGSLPNHNLLQAKFEFLFYIVLLRS